MDAREYDPQAAAGDTMLLQGVVDCCFETDGGVTVVDFKTDQVRTETEIQAAGSGAASGAAGPGRGRRSPRSPGPAGALSAAWPSPWPAGPSPAAAPLPAGPPGADGGGGGHGRPPGVTVSGFLQFGRGGRVFSRFSGRYIASTSQAPVTHAAAAVNGVRLMSIHKSKGLEFPIVILADLDHAFSRQDFDASVLVHPALGLGPRRVGLKFGLGQGPKVGGVGGVLRDLLVQGTWRRNSGSSTWQ